MEGLGSPQTELGDLKYQGTTYFSLEDTEQNLGENKQAVRVLDITSNHNVREAVRYQISCFL